MTPGARGRPMAGPKSSDEELMARLAAGRRDALGPLHGRYAALIFDIAARSLGPDRGRGDRPGRLRRGLEEGRHVRPGAGHLPPVGPADRPPPRAQRAEAARPAAPGRTATPTACTSANVPEPGPRPGGGGLARPPPQDRARRRRGAAAAPAAGVEPGLPRRPHPPPGRRLPRPPPGDRQDPHPRRPPEPPSPPRPAAGGGLPRRRPVRDRPRSATGCCERRSAGTRRPSAW